MSAAGRLEGRRPAPLIGPAELAAQLGDPRRVVVDCRFALADPGLGERLYAATRIPGAVYAHLERDLAGPPFPGSGRHPLPAPQTLAMTLARLGINRDSQVVVYDDSFGSIAARLWWLLRWVGHGDVALLDGGWPAWKRRGLAIESGDPAATDALPPYPVVPDGAMLADADFVEAIRRNPDWLVLDARPEERFSGERDPVDRVAGHIPGSRNRSYEDNLDFGGNFLPPAEMRQSFLETLAGVPPERVVHTCGSGVTACHNLLAMEIAGLSGGRLYAGSWSGWIANPARPVAVGPA